MKPKGFCKLHPAEQVLANGECSRCMQENVRAKHPDPQGFMRRRIAANDRRRGLGKWGKRRCGVRK